MQDFFPKSESDIEKEYKQRIFLTTLKEGKCPKRKCLFKNIFYMSGIYRHYKMVNSVTVSDNHSYDRKYEICVNNHLTPVKTVTENPIFINNLKRYLSDNFRVEVTPYFNVVNCFFIYFNYNKIRWDLIDYDLQQNHSDNILKKPNGFIYVKNYLKLVR